MARPNLPKLDVEPLIRAAVAAIPAEDEARASVTATGVTVLMRAAGVSARQIHRWKHEGVNPWSADRAACALGIHPSLIWGDEWWTVNDLMAGISHGSSTPMTSSRPSDCLVPEVPSRKCPCRYHRSLNLARGERYRRRLGMKPAKRGRTHGLIATYNWGCHCAACRKASREHRARYPARERSRREAVPEAQDQGAVED